MFNQELISITGLIFTISGLYFAYYQWNKTIKDKRRHLIKILKKHLDCLGPWMSSNNEGYSQELTEEQKFDNANPYKLIYDTAANPLISTTILESISDVPDEIIGEIDQLYYDLIRIKNIQDFKNLIVASQPKLSRQIKIKLDNFIATNKKICFCDFIKTLTKNEFFLINIIIQYGSVLHCQVIGNKDHGARNHWEKIMDWVKEEQILKKDVLFLFITFISFSLVILLLTNSILFGLSNLIIKLLLAVSFTVILSLKNKAIIINNTE